MRSVIRNVTPLALPELVRLNNAAVPAVPLSTETDIGRLLELATEAGRQATKGGSVFVALLTAPLLD
ncbi:MAG: hypothetical protein ABI400_09640 [Lacisediminihabitans sp.]